MISDTFAEMRRTLLASIEQAQRELEEETSQRQLEGEAQARRVLTDTRQCALELDSQLRELVQHLEEVRANVDGIRERLTTCLRQLDEPVETKPPAHLAAPAPTADDTVRLLRAALETLSHDRNGERT